MLIIAILLVRSSLKTPHCNHKSCNKCGLYTDAASADQEAMQKAAKAAAQSVSTGRKGVTVDVDALMKKPQPGARVHSNHNGNNHQRHQQPHRQRDHTWRPRQPPPPHAYRPPPRRHVQPPPQQHRVHGPPHPPRYAQPPPPMHPRFGPNDGWDRGLHRGDFR